MKREASTQAIETMMKATIDGFNQVNLIIKSVHQNQKIHAQATYSGLTGSGKSRYVSELVKSYESQAAVAELLDLSRGRICQLVNSGKNKKNGK